MSIEYTLQDAVGFRERALKDMTFQERTILTYNGFVEQNSSDVNNQKEEANFHLERGNFEAYRIMTENSIPMTKKLVETFEACINYCWNEVVRNKKKIEQLNSLIEKNEFPLKVNFQDL